MRLCDLTEERMVTVYHVTQQYHMADIRQDGLQPQIGNNSSVVDDERAVFVFTSWDAMINAVENWEMDWFSEYDSPDIIALTLQVPNSWVEPDIRDRSVGIIRRPVPPEMIVSVLNLNSDHEGDEEGDEREITP